MTDSGVGPKSATPASTGAGNVALGVNPYTQEKGTIHATDEDIEIGKQVKTLCGRALRLLPLDWKAKDDRLCLTCSKHPDR